MSNVVEVLDVNEKDYEEDRGGDSDAYGTLSGKCVVIKTSMR